MAQQPAFLTGQDLNKNKLGLFSGGNGSLVALDDRRSSAGIHHRDDAGVGVEDRFLQPGHFPARRLAEDAGHVPRRSWLRWPRGLPLKGNPTQWLATAAGADLCAEFCRQSLDHAFFIVVHAAQREEDGMADFVRLQHRPCLGERLAPVEHPPQEVCGRQSF